LYNFGSIKYRKWQLFRIEKKLKSCFLRFLLLFLVFFFFFNCFSQEGVYVARKYLKYKNRCLPRTTRTLIMMNNFRVASYYKVQSSYYVVTGNNLFYNLLIETGCLAAPEQSFPFCPLVCLITFGIRLFQNSNSFALYFCFPLGFTSRAR